MISSMNTVNQIYIRRIRDHANEGNQPSWRLSQGCSLSVCSRHWEPIRVHTSTLRMMMVYWRFPDVKFKTMCLNFLRLLWKWWEYFWLNGNSRFTLLSTPLLQNETGCLTRYVSKGNVSSFRRQRVRLRLFSKAKKQGLTMRRLEFA